MATLGNILERRGGAPMTPRVVALTLAIPAADGGAPKVEQVEVALLPVSIQRAARAARAALDSVRETQKPDYVGDPIDLDAELRLRFLCAAMRDPEDLRRAFVASDQVDRVRDVLLHEQLAVLAYEYDQLLQCEYSEVIEHARRIKEEAKQTFAKGQGSQ